MKTQKIGPSAIETSRIAFGCMKTALPWGPERDAEQEKRGLAAIEKAIACGIDFFDHADIYASGKGEVLFGEFLKANPGLREKLFIQSKCGIRFDEPHRFDASKGYILQSVDGILARLDIDYIDCLLLHRPDALVEPEEVAAAFDTLSSAGKVKNFGVSNHPAGQIALLRKFVAQPLLVNQVKFNLMHAHTLEEPQSYDQGVPAGGFLGTLEYCRLHDITLQAYSPLLHGRLGQDDLNEQEQSTLTALQKTAADHSVSVETILIAWILRHPSKIQPVIGTCNTERVANCAAATEIDLSREEWYALWAAARPRKLP